VDSNSSQFDEDWDGEFFARLTHLTTKPAGGGTCVPQVRQPSQQLENALGGGGDRVVLYRLALSPLRERSPKTLVVTH